MIADKILRAVLPVGSEAERATGTVRYRQATWGRVVVTLPKRVETVRAVERVASAIENEMKTHRERWGHHLVKGAVMIVARGWQIIVLADEHRHTMSPPVKASVVEVLFRHLSHTRIEAVPYVKLPGDPKSDPNIAVTEADEGEEK